jgi:hypothetical protein
MSVLAGQPAAAAMAEAAGIWHTALAEMKVTTDPSSRAYGWAEDADAESTSAARWPDDAPGNQLLLPAYLTGSSASLPLLQLEVRKAFIQKQVASESDEDEGDDSSRYECHWGPVLGLAELPLAELSLNQLASLRRADNEGCTCHLPLTDVRGR